MRQEHEAAFFIANGAAFFFLPILLPSGRLSGEGGAGTLCSRASVRR